VSEAHTSLSDVLSKVNGESKMLKRCVLMLGLMSVIFLTACNTMKGAGQDIQSGGEKLENKAEEVQQK
jgi:predicted small secreted protein